MIEQFEFLWHKDLYSKFFVSREPFVVKIEVYGRAAGSTGPAKLLGYTSMDVNNEDGKIAYGHHHLQITNVPSHELVDDYIGF